MMDRPIAGTSTAQHTHKKTSTSITSVGFEPAIPAMQWVQTCALDSDAIGIGGEIMNLVKKNGNIMVHVVIRPQQSAGAWLLISGILSGTFSGYRRSGKMFFSQLFILTVSI